MNRMELYRTLEGRFRDELRSVPNPRDITPARLTDVVFEVLRETPASPGCPDELEAALGQPLADWATAHGPVAPEQLAAALQLLAATDKVPAHWHVGTAIEVAETAVNALRSLQAHLETVHSQAKTLPGHPRKDPA